MIRFAILVGVVQCCQGWSVEGVRPNGRTWCVGKLECSDGALCGREAPDPPRYPIEIHCTGGSIAIVVNDRTIGCQARH